MASLASAPSSQIIHNPADHENGTKSITLEKMVSGAEQAAPLPLPTGVAGGLSAGDEPVEITAVQKMVSAISGSLLTGLLGMFILHASRAFMIRSADHYSYALGCRSCAATVANHRQA